MTKQGNFSKGREQLATMKKQKIRLRPQGRTLERLLYLFSCHQLINEMMLYSFQLRCISFIMQSVNIFPFSYIENFMKIIPTLCRHILRRFSQQVK